MLSRLASSTRQMFTSHVFSGICVSPGPARLRACRGRRGLL